MRRRRLLVLLGVLGLGGGGYWASDDPPVPTTEQLPNPTERPETDTATPTATPTPTPVPGYSETKEYGGKSVTVASPETYRELETTEGTLTAAEGEQFMFLKLTAENVGDQLMNAPWPFEMRWDGGAVEARNSLEGDSNTLESPDRKLYSRPVMGTAGGSEGWVYARIPADLRELTFVWQFETRVRTESDREITYSVPVPRPE